ncbi:Rieske (2Fe-2S) protein [Lentzea tibetensis]|uniref:Cytochrome bc1 complex Rieske iron-sulfur subunit n=1 Tax=Lentzea tibetensis TaxID=2591470 RepID=A0A563EZV2_9PSEU|nr:Rieske (2Fe-2S) protein [Lentzea tibetensis]TWP53250.1 Rieske (2Fe-2S) protein [Lentzea tibetensis]
MGLSRRAVIAGAGLAAAGCSTYGGSTPQQTQAPAGTELAKTADIPPGGGIVLGDKGVVVVQPQESTFKAFTSTCTHQGCTVANVQGEMINCTCHGSKFNIADGTVAEGPATQPLAEKKIAVQGDSIQLA